MYYNGFMTIATGIMGATGFTGVELIDILGRHPEFELRVAGSNSSAGELVASQNPFVSNLAKDLKYTDLSLENFAGLDLVFAALPHNTSANIIPDLIEKYGVRRVVDLSADFRLKDSGLYESYYGFNHPRKDWLQKAVFGIPELYRDNMKDAQLVAAAGCYVTAVTLAVHPFLKAKVVADTIIADCASGVTGAGKKLAPATQFTTVNENFSVYGLINHRHRPEIEQVCENKVLFTPHLLPIDRGILATCYFKVTQGVSVGKLQSILSDCYQDESFVKVLNSPPDLKSICNTNFAGIFVTLDEATDTAIVVSAIDNLLKGASGQAVQCANAVFGLDESMGLN